MRCATPTRSSSGSCSSTVTRTCSGWAPSASARGPRRCSSSRSTARRPPSRSSTPLPRNATTWATTAPEPSSRRWSATRRSTPTGSRPSWARSSASDCRSTWPPSSRPRLPDSRRRPREGSPGLTGMDDRPATAAPLLSARDLVVGHEGVQACAPVTVDLHPAAALALIGPNGVGKSTVLHTLLGLLPPLAGEVAFHGHPVDERRSSFRRDVAQVLDDDAFFPSLTAREHLLLTARGHGVLDAEETVAPELATFGIEDRADALPSRLSSGQRRRLALAAAFVRPARLLVLDEPERRLDTEMRSALAERVATERDRGLTVLFASHDVACVGTVADEAMLLTEEKCRLLPLRAVPGAMTGADG